MLGCDWGACTQIHRYEELLKVPYRYFKEFKSYADYGEGRIKEKVLMYVRNLRINPEVNTNELLKSIELAKSFSKENIFRGQVSSIETKELREICMTEIENNQYKLFKNHMLTKYMVEQSLEAKSNREIKVAILSHSNIENLKNSLLKQVCKLIP